MHLGAFLALVVRLSQGILAIQSPAAPVRTIDAIDWALAAAIHAHRSGLDPFELVGIARNETDFRPALVGPDGKDCGMTQTRVTYSRYRCAQLRRSTWLAFEEAARELSQNQARCTKSARRDVARCRLNSYNSGVRYARRGWAGNYWLRVSCFAEAARGGVAPRGDCRRARSLEHMLRVALGGAAPERLVSLGRRLTSHLE